MNVIAATGRLTGQPELKMVGEKQTPKASVRVAIDNGDGPRAQLRQCPSLNQDRRGSSPSTKTRATKSKSTAPRATAPTSTPATPTSDPTKATAPQPPKRPRRRQTPNPAIVPHKPGFGHRNPNTPLSPQSLRWRRFEAPTPGTQNEEPMETNHRPTQDHTGALATRFAPVERRQTRKDRTP